ncbi:MAG: hypothetical protein KDG52_09685 [Rhodocyclaceae bacterium]|nr:hypothetical protein [Rhodocyclaceae bacterium]
MNVHQDSIDPSRAGAAAALAGMATAVVTGAACIGPMIGIAFGIGGLGWLARYAHLQLPATLLTIALLALGFRLLYRRRDCGGTGRRRARTLLWVAVVFAVAINAFEYVVLPALG